MPQFSITVAFVVLLGLCASTGASEYQVGVYYFPGWKDDQRGAAFAKPWDKIKPFPEREPMLGWYKEGDPRIAEQHIQWMADHGVDFIAYDWFWDENDRTFLEHGIRAYLKANNNDLVRFALLWANPERRPVPGSHQNFRAMVRFWLAEYFSHPQYLRIDGKPVVFVFSPSSLRNHARKFGKSTSQLLSEAREMAREAGHPGVYFVASVEAVDYWVRYAHEQGYDALSAYNYHRGLSGKMEPTRRFSYSFEELADNYKEQWSWIIANSNLPYFVPTTSGWDRRPWGGSKDPAHDNSMSNPNGFEKHLLAARKLIDENPGRTRRTVMICCWNEFGEGSFIEPTKSLGFEYLRRVRKVFAD